MDRRAAWSLAAALALLASRPASATTVVLVHSAGPRAGLRWRAAELRARDELHALGMTTAEVPARDTDDGTIAALLAEHAADAAVHVERTGERASVTVWVSDAATGAARNVSLTLDGHELPGLAALRAAELVRSETLPREGPAPSAPAPPAVEAPLIPPPPWTPQATPPSTSCCPSGQPGLDAPPDATCCPSRQPLASASVVSPSASCCPSGQPLASASVVSLSASCCPSGQPGSDAPPDATCCPSGQPLASYSVVSPSTSCCPSGQPGPDAPPDTTCCPFGQPLAPAPVVSVSPGAPPRPAAPLTPDFADDIALPPAPAIARPPATGSAEDIPRPLAPAIARPPAADLVDDAPPPSAPKSPPRRHALVVAATVVGGRGLDTVLTGLEIAGRRELRRRLDLGADVMSVLTPTWQAQPRGSILFGLTTARVTLTLRLPLGARTSLLLSGGGGLALGWAVGRAAPPYRGTADTRPGGVLSAALALATRLGPRTSLHAGAALDVLMPSLKVRTTGIEIATLGAPLLRGVLGLSWDWLLPARPRR